MIELRATGGQTIIPPSLHPSGERLLWHQNAPPAQIDAEALTRIVNEVASAALLARTWPVEGSRHDTALALSGALVRGGWDDEKISRFIRAVADAAGDEEAKERARQGIYSRRRIETGRRATGLPTLEKFLGEGVVGKVAEWLNLGRSIEGHDHAQATHFTLTDDGNSDRLVDRHGKDLKWCPELGWMFYDGKRWVEDKTGEVRRRAVDTVKAIGTEAAAEPDSAKSADLFKHAARSLSDAKTRAMISSAESKLPITLSEFDISPWLLNTEDGTLDFKTREFQKHQREDLITRLAPVRYDLDAKCPEWERFLFRTFKNNLRLIDFVQRAVGYSLTGDTREQVLLILYGRGQNGKSTFLEVLSSALGNYAMHTPSETLMMKRDAIPNDIARLRGTRFVCATETEEGRRMSEVMVKQLTGGDQVTARFLHREWFQFRPTFKLWLACNHRPVIRGTDFAIWRRIRLIPFTVTIPPEEQDRELPDKLREELPGILGWAIDGCQAWLEEGLGAPEEVQSATAEYREEMDVTGAFLDECCNQKPGATTPARDLYTAYTAWCGQNGEHALTQRTFGTKLTERGFLRDKGTGGVREWRGIELVSGTSG